MDDVKTYLIRKMRHKCYYWFFQSLLISSNVFPLVSGTIFHTNIADNTDITPYSTYVNVILKASSIGKVDETTKFAIHCAATAIATAFPRMVFGKISEISTQQIGPHDIINAAV